MSSTGWKVGDVYQIGDFVGLVGDVTPVAMALEYYRKQDPDPIFKGNLASAPEYLAKLLKLDE